MSLGLEIAIEKRVETETEVVYAFFVREGRGGVVLKSTTGRPGEVSIAKASGDVTLLESCPDDIDDGVLFPRVGAKLSRHWSSGTLPEKTSWAA